MALTLLVVLINTTILLIEVEIIQLIQTLMDRKTFHVLIGSEALALPFKSYHS